MARNDNNFMIISQQGDVLTNDKGKRWLNEFEAERAAEAHAKRGRVVYIYRQHMKLTPGVPVKEAR